jgi:RimJ/RimL family protein N-acetyltransferase
MSPLDDIPTPRLRLRVMGEEVTAACLAGDLARAERLLGVAIPGELLDRPTGLRFNRARLAEDPLYPPWSMRAIVLPESATMVGHVRFHTRPDPEYLQRYARDAVEFGYQVFAAHRRRGYATEATRALMDWAQAEFGVRRFVVSISPGNTPSLRLAARLGFVRVGEEMDEVDGLEYVFLRGAE